MVHSNISVLIPVFNEKHNIERCLNSIRQQDYPQKKVQIILIDDYSTDNTLNLAKKYKVKVLYNGSHNIERAKSIGLEHAKSEYILFIDADNTLVSKRWLTGAYNIFLKYPDIVGVESFKVKHDMNDTIVNRYCALFGINEPLVFYLGRRGYLMANENTWPLPKDTLLADHEDCFIAKFGIDNLQTIGSNGYLTKKSLLLKTNWSPYLFHLDSAYDLVKMGYNKFGRIKLEIGHNYADSIKNLLHKSKRNADLFLKFNRERRYTYNLGSLRSIMAVLICLTFVIPLIDSIKGYLKIKDPAWFLHPFLCFTTVSVYIYATLYYRIKKLIFYSKV